MIDVTPDFHRAAGPSSDRDIRDMTGSRRTAHPLRRHAMRRAAILAAGGMLLALAACESTPSDEANSNTAESPASTAQTDGTAAAGNDEVVEAHMTMAKCEKPDNGRVHFRVGKAVFAVPGDDVRTVIPPDVTPETPKEQIVERLRKETRAGAGCPESPLTAALLAVAGPADDPLVGNEILLFQTRGIADDYGKLTNKMLANADKCQKAGDGLLACGVVDRNGDKERRLLYLVSTDRSQKLAFGGPLAARCIVAGERISCEILDELPGGVGLRAPLKGLPENSAALAGAHQRALAAVRPLRL